MKINLAMLSTFFLAIFCSCQEYVIFKPVSELVTTGPGEVALGIDDLTEGTLVLNEKLKVVKLDFDRSAGVNRGILYVKLQNITFEKITIGEKVLWYTLDNNRIMKEIEHWNKTEVPANGIVKIYRMSPVRDIKTCKLYLKDFDFNMEGSEDDNEEKTGS